MSRSEFLISIVENLEEDTEIATLPGPAGDVEHGLVYLLGRKEQLCEICATDPIVKRKQSYY